MTVNIRVLQRIIWSLDGYEEDAISRRHPGVFGRDLLKKQLFPDVLNRELIQ